MNLIVLDRDGVINEDSGEGEFVKSPEEWVPIPGSLEAITRLHRSGHHVVLATNQSGVGRGLLTIETLNKIHCHMVAQLAEIGGAIEAIFFCPHAPRDKCRCRKPEPGMLLDIAERLRLPLEGVPVVGDRLRDLTPAAAVGARPVLVRTGRGMETEAAGELPDGTAVYEDLAAFVDELLAAPDAASE